MKKALIIFSLSGIAALAFMCLLGCASAPKPLPVLSAEQKPAETPTSLEPVTCATPPKSGKWAVGGDKPSCDHPCDWGAPEVSETGATTQRPKGLCYIIWMPSDEQIQERMPKPKLSPKPVEGESVT
jgi:hypothetical protein